jgi:hypothetical protein
MIKIILDIADFNLLKMSLLKEDRSQILDIC